jgi:hypothetical protein
LLTERGTLGDPVFGLAVGEQSDVIILAILAIMATGPPKIRVHDMLLCQNMRLKLSHERIILIALTAGERAYHEGTFEPDDVEGLFLGWPHAALGHGAPAVGCRQHQTQQ